MVLLWGLNTSYLSQNVYLIVVFVVVVLYFSMSQCTFIARLSLGMCYYAMTDDFLIFIHTHSRNSPFAKATLEIQICDLYLWLMMKDSQLRDDFRLL